MSTRTSILLSVFFVVVGCGSSDDTTPPVVTDSGTDSAKDSSDALANTCTPTGGTCIALTATAKCPDGSHTPTDGSIHCEGVGSMCCVPDATDGGKDVGPDATDASDASDATDTTDGGAEAGCLASGGTVTTTSCCLSTTDFPNSCLTGACGCAPTSSHDVKTCSCGTGKCFDGKSCVSGGG